MKRLQHALLAVVAGTVLGACSGQKGPPRHPVGEMSARATAKLDVIDLIVSDPARAGRVRQVYEQLAALGQEFDLARARSMVAARSTLEGRSTEAAQSSPADSGDLERMLAPPLVEGKVMFERYTALMLEARSLLTEDEFEKLNAVR